jgi:hypothetical protein
MIPLDVPKSITPLTPATSDMDVIDGKTDKPAGINETDEARILLSLVKDYDRQEEFVRQEVIRKCRKGMLYWNSQQYLAWDEVSSDWKTAEQIAEDDPTADIDPALYAKVVNVYKAHGEILIGALTAGLPTVRFPPKDADDPEDVSTSKAYTKIAELIQKHNRAKLLLMKALYILYNQGMVACYNENKADYRFGSIKVPDYADVPIINRNHYCPACGEQLGAHQFPAPPPQGPPPVLPPGPPTGMEDPQAPVGTMGGFHEHAPTSLPSGPPNPGDTGLPPAPPQAIPQPNGPPPPTGPTLPPQTCPTCGNQVQPEFDDQQGMQTQTVGEHDIPKNRECLEIYGPMNVKIPVWCKDQFSTPYVILETEEHVALLREIYHELADKIQASGYPDTWEREARVPSNYRNDFPRDIVTVQRVWLRPWALNNYINQDEAKTIKAKYKSGVYVVIINHDLVAEIVEDKLDDHWTISENPLSDTLHPEPIGSAMIPLQDIENETTNLTLETIEFGIPETFADPRTIDFDAYRRQEARPGQISPATAPAGHSLGEGFFSVKASTLSKEVSGFAERNTSQAQFVMGSYPSVYGGSSQGGSGTAREYELSRTSALQRLSSTWTIVQEWWARAIGKAVKSFADNMLEDEKTVQVKGSSFINVWIRKAEMSGTVGDVEPEISEAFPVSWSQKRDVIMNLMQMKDPDVAAVVRHPENAGLVATIIGVPELYIPGDDDRTKQLMEIAELIKTEPQMGPPDPMTGQPKMISTVPITPDLDNNVVEAEICKSWLISEIGQDAKKNNPGGYANVLAHKKEHDAAAAAMMAPPMGAPGMDTQGLNQPGAGGGAPQTGPGQGPPQGPAKQPININSRRQ